MPKTGSTGWVYARDGDITQIDLTAASNVVSARIRWRGVKRIDTAHNDSTVGWTSRPAGVEDVIFGSLPSVPSGHSFSRHRIWTSISSGSSGAYEIEHYIDGDLVGSKSGAASYVSLFTHHHTNESGQSVEVVVQHAADYELWTQWRTTGTRDVQTSDPHATIEGSSYQHLGTINDGVVTDWVDLHALTANTSLDITHSIGGGERVQYEIEYIYEPRLPEPNRIEPESAHRTNNRQPVFELELTEEADNSSDKYHAGVQISKYTTMNPLTLSLESINNTGEWELWNTEASIWEPFPLEGVDPGSLVRVKPETHLDYGNLYWTAASLDNWHYGYNTTHRNLRILLSIKGRYDLLIEGESYDAFSVQVSETANGEIASIEFELANADGSAYAEIGYGDEVILGVIDTLGNEEEYIGRVREKSPSGKYLAIRATTGDGILGERRVKEDYSAQDIGATVAHIINNYCQPLTSNNVDLNTGFGRPVQADGKKAIAVLEDIRREYGIHYYVDKDWDVHFYKPDAIGNHFVAVRYGE